MEKENRRRTREQLKLDQSLRMLFRLSRRMTVQLINGLFGENHPLEETAGKLRYGNAEFVADALERIVGDWFVSLETEQGTYHYHVEFQTLNDREMAIRMFRYGFEKAQELERSGEERWQVLAFPRQVVIFLEENEQIGEELSLRLRLPDGSEIDYRVPVLRYWTYSAEELRRRQLYALLPLQVFASRKRLRQIAASRIPDEEKRRRIAEEFARLKTTVERTLAVIREWMEKEQVSLQAIDRMLQVMEHILTYLYRRYGEQFQTMKREVTSMAKSYLDWKQFERGREEGREEGELQGKLAVAKQLLAERMDAAFIGKVTGLSAEQIQQLHQQEQEN